MDDALNAYRGRFVRAGSLAAEPTSSTNQQQQDDVSLDLYDNVPPAASSSEKSENTTKTESPKRPNRAQRRRKLRSKAEDSSEAPSQTSDSDVDMNRLFSLVQNGELEEVYRCFKTETIDLTKRDQYQWTLLMTAAFGGYAEIVLLILENGGLPTINWTNQRSQTAADLAFSNGYPELAACIVNYEGNFPEDSAQNSEQTANQPRICPTCGIEVTDDCHETSTIHLLNTKQPTQHSSYEIPVSNRGYQLMLRSGWTGTGGLGSSGEGRNVPVPTVLKRDKTGLGASELRRRVTHFRAHDRSAVDDIRRRANNKPYGRLSKADRAERRKQTAMSRAKEAEFRRAFKEDDM